MNDKPTERRNNFYQSPLVTLCRCSNRGRGGRGVFALQDIKQNQIIERVPCILMPEKEVYPDGFDLTTQNLASISHYVFHWPFKEKGKDMVALALGYGSLYNHSYSANAHYVRSGKDFMHFYAVKDIAAGKEIFINYNGSPNNKTKLDFKVTR
jgi:SET domain-containing protein